jgi:hypothetical protein
LIALGSLIGVADIDRPFSASTVFSTTTSARGCDYGRIFFPYLFFNTLTRGVQFIRSAAAGLSGCATRLAFLRILGGCATGLSL